MRILGIKLIGFNAANGQKLVLSLALIALAYALSVGLRRAAIALMRPGKYASALFWTRQAISLGAATLVIVGLLSIWFDDPTRLATGLGLVTAGLAFALQKVVTSVAGYFVILRGNNFSVGDRIQMGGVRGDVIGLGFIQTTILEMGQPPAVQNAEPAMWVKSRQFTGRIVTVSNAKVFEEPVFNYTRDFPYIWEEIALPVSYTDDRAAAERVLLDAVKRYALKPEEVEPGELDRMQNRYFVDLSDLAPRAYYRITDNWLEITARFLTREHGACAMKDQMHREILAGLDAAGVGIASATFGIVGLPPVAVRAQPDDAPR